MLASVARTTATRQRALPSQMPTLPAAALPTQNGKTRRAMYLERRRLEIFQLERRLRQIETLKGLATEALTAEQREKIGTEAATRAALGAIERQPHAYAS